MTVTRKAPARKSGNPATAAAAKRAAAEQDEAAQAAQAAAVAKAKAEFEALELDAPVFDEDGYEVIPDRAALEGGSYRFKIKGHPFVLPNLQYLPVGMAKKLKAASTETEAQEIIFGRYAPELMEYAGQAELIHVMKRWTDLSRGISLGE